jgi:hypothetical protein
MIVAQIDITVAAHLQMHLHTKILPFVASETAFSAADGSRRFVGPFTVSYSSQVDPWGGSLIASR